VSCTKCGRAGCKLSRGLCGRCYLAAWKRGEHFDHERKTWARGDLVEEVRFLLGCSYTAAEVCEKLGRKPRSISRAAYRAGDVDIARQFGSRSVA